MSLQDRILESLPNTIENLAKILKQPESKIAAALFPLRTLGKVRFSDHLLGIVLSNDSGS